MPGANLTFVTGSTNYRPSTLKDHAQTDIHIQAVGEEAHSEAEASDISLQTRKVYQAVPSRSSIVQGLIRMGDNERESVTKLLHIAFHVATKGLPFKYFKDEIDLQKLHDVKFQAGAYENESACPDFILNISNFLFDKLVRENLSRVNFFAILCDGSTDHSITEQEIVYVAYANPDFFQPCLKFCHLASPKDSQDARGLKECILSAFEDHGMKDLIPKIVFLVSDSA